MKEIKAVIQPVKLQKLRTALTALADFPGMTVVRAEGCGPTADKAKRPMDIHQQLTDFSPKIRIEILAADALALQIVDIIRETCHTGHMGDGIVWVTAAESFARIRKKD